MLIPGSRVLIWFSEEKSEKPDRHPHEPIPGSVVGRSPIGWLVIQCDRGHGHGRVWCPDRFVEEVRNGAK